MGRAGAGSGRAEPALRRRIGVLSESVVQHREQVQSSHARNLRVAGSNPAVATTETDIPSRGMSVALFLAPPPAHSRMVPRSPWSAACLSSRFTPGVSTMRSIISRLRRPPRPGRAGSPAPRRAARPCTVRRSRCWGECQGCPPGRRKRGPTARRRSTGRMEPSTCRAARSWCCRLRRRRWKNEDARPPMSAGAALYRATDP